MNKTKMAELEQKQDEGLTPPKEYYDRLSLFHQSAAKTKREAPYMFGYPNNLRDVGRVIDDVHKVMPRNLVLDNCLDPYLETKSHMRNQVEEHERLLVQELAAPWIKSGVKDLATYVTSGGKESRHDLWGYIATGGTEGVFKGLVTGIQNMKKRHIVLFTGDAHFSVSKAIATCQQESIKVKALNNGQMDLDDLEKVLEFVKRAHYEQVILMPTLGTTFKGAIDDLDGMLERTKKFFDRSDVYIHLDAAFFGGYWHHIDDAPQYWLREQFDSFSVSGHKWYGGLIAACFFTQAHVESAPAEYLNMEDKELSGSKNGYNPLMWRARLKQFDWEQEYLRCKQNQRLLEVGFQARKIPCFSNVNSLITIFPMPSDEVCTRFQLATLCKWAHVCMMAHISSDDLNEFFKVLDSTGDAKRMAEATVEVTDSTGWPAGVSS